MSHPITTHVIGTIVHINDVPPLSNQLGRSVLGETVIDRAVHRHPIVVVDQDQIVQSEMAG